MRRGVVVLDRAFADPRLTILARALRCRRGDAAWRMLELYAHADSTGGPVPVGVAAVIMRCRPERVVAALEGAGLGRCSDNGGAVEVNARGLFEPDQGSSVPAEQRPPHRQPEESLEEAIMDCLASGGTMTRASLRAQLGQRNATVSLAVRSLLEAGRVTETRDGLSLAFPAERSRERDGNVPGNSCSVPEGGKGGEPRPDFSDRSSSWGADPERSRERDGNIPGNAELASEELVQRGPMRDRVARLLWEEQERIRRAIVPEAPSLAFDRPIQNGPLDVLSLLLASYSPAQLMHVLAVRRAEAEGRLAAGDDPLQYLNGVTNWKEDCVRHALGTTVEAMRKRFRRKPTRPAFGRTESVAVDAAAYELLREEG